MQICDLDPQHWVNAACRLAGRNLTREEWVTNIGALRHYRPTSREIPRHLTSYTSYEHPP